MTPQKLPYEQFLKTFELAPRVAVNLLIEGEVYETSRGGKEILLTKRQKPPFAGSWHLPGSFVLKGEALIDCVRRVAKEELGVKVESVKLAGAFDDISGDPRGHVVDLVYRYKVKKGLSFPRKDSPLHPIGDTAAIRFFKKLPANIGFNHRETLMALGYR